MSLTCFVFFAAFSCAHRNGKFCPSKPNQSNTGCHHNLVYNSFVIYTDCYSFIMKRITKNFKKKHFVEGNKYFYLYFD